MATYPLIKRTHRISRLIGMFLVLAFLAGSIPQPALAASCRTNYTVKSGDTLSSIALQFKISWTDLAAANNLKEPYTIYIGQVLCIPASATTTSSTSTTSSSSKRSFSVAVQGSSLVISTTNFPKNNIYYVKISAGHFRPDPPVYKIGTLRVGKNTTYTYTFRFPKELSSAKYVLVCLKNVVTDANTCRSIAR
ncbi:MAG TPA: LysM peptidoglycan-binding domain-containing protein [Anaerolineales bacterium]|nr:LysM peptidoglycan-binding domain-containing protein [Anaerolineales bacterium]